MSVNSNHNTVDIQFTGAMLVELSFLWRLSSAVDICKDHYLSQIAMFGFEVFIVFPVKTLKLPLSPLP